MNATPARVESQLTDKGYVPVYTTAVVEQPWSAYTPTDHQVWAQLFERQQKILVGRASQAFLDAQRAMHMSALEIPTEVGEWSTCLDAEYASASCLDRATRFARGRGRACAAECC